MSNPIKKIFKGVKKVFKKVVKVVKKVLPVVVAAAAIYYGGYALTNGTLTGSGTHLSSMLSGQGMGQGGSLFLPGAGSNAANMLASKGMTVGQGWLGGSGIPGMGTKQSVTAINNSMAQTTAFNTEVASNYAMTESVDAAGNFTDLGAGANYTAPTAPVVPTDPASMSAASPAEFAPTNQVSKVAQQPSVYDPINTGGAGAPDMTMLSDSPYTEKLTGVSTSGGTFPKDLAIQSGQNPNIFANTSATNALATPPPMPSSAGLSFQEQYFKNKLLADQAAKEAAANAPWYSKAWSGLGDYGKMAAIQTGGSLLSGYAQGKAQEEENLRADQKEQDARDRLNAQRFGGFQYIPGQGVVFVPYNPMTA